jgi:hypothetical protein
MVEHLVWFKMKDGATPADREELCANLRALKQDIPEIHSIACGEDFSGRSRGFEVGLLVRFKDRRGLEIYQPHPAHLAFIERCKHLWSEVQALDFEDTND